MSKRGVDKHAPIVQVVNIAKALHCAIPKRSEKQNNTVNELARDIIWTMIRKYRFTGVE